MPFRSREKDFHVSQFITCIGAGDIKTGVSLYWWNQYFVGVCLPVLTSHSSARPRQWTSESPWVCVQLKLFVHRAKESPLLLKQTNKKQQKQQDKERKEFKCMAKWTTYLISPCSASVQSKPPTPTHRYKGVTCSSVHQQPKILPEDWPQHNMLGPASS